MKNLSASDKILYSYLIYIAVSNIEGVYDTDGNLDSLLLSDILADDDYWGIAYGTSIRKLANITMLSSDQCRKSINKLKKEDYVRFEEDNNYYVHLLKDIVMSYGFDIDLSMGKPTALMIFYFYLKDKASRYNGTVDTWKSKIAKDYNTSTDNVREMIKQLKKKGLIERNENKSKYLTIN